MRKKFLVFAPPYDELSGGSVVLHKLCWLLNELGYESYLHRDFPVYTLHTGTVFSSLYRQARSYLRGMIVPYRTHSDMQSPLYRGKTSELGDDWIVVYHEQVPGNPLGARNVVRWLLHQPGYHTGKVYYGTNELYFKFNTAIHDFKIPGSTIAKNHLKVVHYPLDLYNKKDLPAERKGTAYCLRKGAGKKIVHSLDNSTLIDALPHAQVAEIFKRSRRFISYDTHTAYSLFAVLCGCESVVVPDAGVDIDEWYPDEEDRYGIAYGFENLDFATKTAHLVEERVRREEQKSRTAVDNFALEATTFFS